MTKEVFKRMMGIFFISFPNKVIDMNLCWEMLKDIPDSQFIVSVKKIIATQTEICQSTNLIALIRKNAIKNEIPGPADAWAEVLRLVSSTGSYGYPVFSHPAIKRAVDGIGWRSICMSENIAFERAHFFRIYDQIVDREEKEILLSEGLIENAEVRGAIQNLSEKLSAF